MDRSAPSLESRRFGSVGEVEGGEVGSGTVFTYHEDGDLIWAEYSGGSIRRGYLVGLRTGDELDFRYVQVNDEGRSSSGHCRSTIVVLPDGRLRMDERWRWESRPGSGVSVVEELPDGAVNR